jgi:CDP-diacylglycerol--glycerol-3-phosphate 3-phosphatidyltransferase
LCVIWIIVKRHLPFALTTLRLLLGPLALVVAFCHWPRLIFLPLLVTGTLSDIFDGILARRYGVATPALRRYDSITVTCSCSSSSGTSVMPW